MVTIRMNIISRILHLFSACFADYTHPREGTETFKSRIYFTVFGTIILIPARGRKQNPRLCFLHFDEIILIPARGRKLVETVDHVIEK